MNNLLKKIKKWYLIILLSVIIFHFLFGIIFKQNAKIESLKFQLNEVMRREKKVAGFLFEIEEAVKNNPTLAVEMSFIVKELNRLMFNREVVILKDNKFIDNNPK